MCTSKSLELVKVSLFGNKAFAEDLQYVTILDLGWALNPITGVFMNERRGRAETQDTEETYKEKGCVKMSVETRVPQPQARESLQPPEAGRGKEEFSPRAIRVSMALPTP